MPHELVKNKNEPRASHLDGLRFVLFFGVFMYHADFGPDLKMIHKEFWFLNYALPFFFIHSGWMVTKILDDSCSLGLDKWALIKNFYIRRMFRILPGYFAVLLAYYFLAGNQFFLSKVTFTYNLLLAAKTLGSANISYLNMGNTELQVNGMQFWSLCVEEQFYLFFPIMFVLFRKSFLAWGFGLIAISNLARFWFLSNEPHSLYGALPLISGEFLGWGCILYIICKEIPNSFNNLMIYIPMFTLAALMLTGVPSGVPELRNLFPGPEQSLYAAIFSVLVAGITRSSESLVSKALSLKPLPWLGERTYVMYLSHPAMWPLCDKLGLVGLPWKLALTIAFSAVMWEFVEKPFLKMRPKSLSPVNFAKNPVK